MAGVARLIFPVDTVATLARTLGVPKTTVRSWYDGRRRMPVDKLKALKKLLGDYYNQAGQQLYVLGQYLHQREFEPPRKLTGVCDGRYRKLRPSL